MSFIDAMILIMLSAIIGLLLVLLVLILEIPDKRNLNRAEEVMSSRKTEASIHFGLAIALSGFAAILFNTGHYLAFAFASIMIVFLLFVSILLFFPRFFSKLPGGKYAIEKIQGIDNRYTYASVGFISSGLTLVQNNVVPFGLLLIAIGYIVLFTGILSNVARLRSR